MESKFKDRISKLSDDELLDLYEVCYSDYRVEVLEYAKEEIVKRGIEKKVWFYNDRVERYGPYSRDEIVNLVENGEIKHNFNIWHEGMSDWVRLEDMKIPGIKEFLDKIQMNKNTQENKSIVSPPPMNHKSFGKVDGKNYDYEGQKSGIKLAGILLNIVGGILVLISILQLFAGLFEGDVEYFILAGWNMIVSIGMIIISQGLRKYKKWSYSWGVGTSAINIIFHFIEFINSENNLNVFLFILHCGIFVLLIRNKKIFKDIKDEHDKTTK